jgi:HSP20 family molecular chaperone IbpA
MKTHTAVAPTRKIAIKPASITDFWNDVSRQMKQIEQRAFQLFEWRGREDGHDLEDWVAAEKEFLTQVPLEIEEKDNVLHISADLPGFQPQELEINLEPQRLTIKAFQKKESQKEGEKTLYSEKQTKQVFRQVSLPLSVVPDKADAILKDGVLDITVPKAEKAKPIKVKAA